ncbi:hypothetical protein [Pseudomonas guariconensis]|uniref:hypothetical protein n=1 Tax=Pseudomonas guariconensis TaxID=1288410 RepID=UPI0018A91E42|nr:hypothetical protein [Pseudomonas guariconensis]MBF8740223.1 hypothetical protein [Pseudomonas guariconensis]MBF8750366.1 hypothetical protein [Pseudomonas guariconensis]
MVDFKSKGYTNEQIYAIIEAFEASDEPITEFCKNRDYKPSYQTLAGWLKKVGKPTTKKATTASKPTPAPTAVPTTPEAIKAQIAKLQDAYKDSLLSEIDKLKADIERMQQKLAAAEKELEEITA